MVMRICQHNCFILIKSSWRIVSHHLPFQIINNNAKVGCEKCSRLIKKTIVRRKSIVVVHLLGLNKLYTLFECFYGRFQKASKCPVWYSMLISSHIHNAANRAIAKNSWQSYFKKSEVLFSRKQQGAIRTDCKFILTFSATFA